jgi:hypothetical protein
MTIELETKTGLEIAEGRRTYPDSNTPEQSKLLKMHWVSLESHENAMKEAQNEKQVAYEESNPSRGMDMAFATVYAAGRRLYPKGDGKTITNRNGDKNPETDGGYLLKSIVV